MRSFRSGMTPLRAGVVGLVIVVIGCYFAFTKNIPFTSKYEVQAVFENSNLIAPRSPVRIAGVDVGRVTAVGRYKDTDLSVVTMEIDERGRPIGEDATLKVRPRLFLEGNFFLELKPGTPGAEELADGGMIPVAQTAAPTQLDQVLTTLQADTRRSLQDALIGFGEALDSEPTAADDADQDPDVRGLTAAQALNKALVTAVPALRGSAIGAQSLRGTEPRDLSRLIKGVAGTGRGLARDQQALRELFTNFNIAMGTLAQRAPQLERTVELLAPTSANLRRGLRSIDAALPPTQRFSRAMLPAVRETPVTIAAAGPWLDQAIPFFGPDELGGFLEHIAPATRDLARVTHAQREFVPKSDDFNRCISDVIIPTGNIVVDDGEFSSGVENYKEFWYAATAQAGEAQGFDGNGPMLRLTAPGGDVPVTSGKTNYQHEALHANATQPLLRTAPAFPNRPPPLRRDVPCHRNPVPDVNGPGSVGPADGSRANASPPPVPPKAAGAVPIADAATSQLLPLSSFREEAP